MFHQGLLNAGLRLAEIICLLSPFRFSFHQGLLNAGLRPAIKKNNKWFIGGIANKFHQGLLNAGLRQA